ncbi:ferredoxin reductase-like protein [Suhomyces tanzawaensis NRRL Y-17324]|uniref:NADH-cytochrome b5 reductase n=1 Tax=Suhomyces tanzawaensis NRRL Y-17324 TaxID=984487 RepID=A0A1E4SQW5_9ASCO|nr:ferredoxin reductase-like protein [Suhomyces tanzawaensis NRRL Y-17324]ODV81903.1 ferredoxin reductase-like protein [Suhomyces tanzawaensis NRRL Y-17324]
MSFAHQLTRLSNPRVLFPFVAAVGSVGLAYHYSTRLSFIANETAKAFSNSDEWIDLKLAKSYDVSHDSKVLVFHLPEKDHVSGLVTASCVLTKFVTPKGNNVIRPYTPISDVDQKGTIEFVIKKYEGGKMSTYTHDLKENDTLSFKGPIVKWKWEPNQYKEIALIGGGSGITPLYQLVHQISKNPEDKTKVQLFYGSQTEEDILIKEELDALVKKNPEQIKIHYFVDKASDKWEGNTGYVTKEFLEANLPGPSKDSKIFVCGPPALYKSVSGPKVSPTDQGEVTGALADLGYTKEHVYKF